MFSPPLLSFHQRCVLVEQFDYLSAKEGALHVNYIQSKMEEVLEYQTSSPNMPLFGSSEVEICAGLGVHIYFHYQFQSKKNIN